MNPTEIVEELIKETVPKKPCTIDFMTLDPPERSRTYYFECGKEVTFTNIVKLFHTKSGNHMLESASGDKFIVANKWTHIKVETESWT